ncbi:MAG: hypothetical protein AAFY60_22500 [Myxococcota bacterium]
MLHTIALLTALASTPSHGVSQTAVYVRPSSEFLTEMVRARRGAREQERLRLETLKTERAQRVSAAQERSRLLRTALILPVMSAPAMSWL